jgi:hypothetical protein
MQALTRSLRDGGQTLKNFAGWLASQPDNPEYAALGEVLRSPGGSIQHVGRDPLDAGRWEYTAIGENAEGKRVVLMRDHYQTTLFTAGRKLNVRVIERRQGAGEPEPIQHTVPIRRTVIDARRRSR